MLGPDFVNILKTADNKTVTSVALDLGSRGTRQAMTMTAMKLDDFIS